jgi:hemoglobin-like flavoprotein
MQVMDTWRIVEKDLNKHATTFYETMFEMAPAIRELFKNRGEDHTLEDPAALLL